MARTRVLVCGATGFIGRNIATALAGDDRYEVIGVYHEKPPFEHPGIGFVQADLTDAADTSRVIEGAEIVIQAAATTSGAGDIIRRPYIHVADNAVMNSHIMRAAFNHRVREFVFFSCSIMYQNSETPVREDDFDIGAELHPAYFGAGWTKLYIEKMCEFYSRISDTRFTVIRHSNIYGPHDKFDLERSHVFGATITKVMTNTDGRIVVWGRGEEARDLVYVSDLVDFVKLALGNDRPPFRIYNVGAGAAVKIKDLVAKINAASGRQLRIEHDLSRPTVATSLCLDITRAREELGWQPRVPLDQGIARTLDWYRDAFGESLPQRP